MIIGQTRHHSRLILHRQSDPTRTLVLRRRYMAQARKRWREVQRTIRQAIIQDDVFLLQPPPSPFASQRRGAFGFGTIAERVRQFIAWVREQMTVTILDEQGGWHRDFIQLAYEHGMTLANELIEPPDEMPFERRLRQRGGNAARVDELEEQERTGLEAILTTAAVALGEVARRLLQRGESARTMVREIREPITRATAATQERASTIVVEATNEAILDTAEQAGLREVIAEPEFQFTTAGDARVCKRCRALEGRIYTIRQARGVIPVHNRCRCRWTPIAARRPRREAA